jgi:hypothetical protein
MALSPCLDPTDEDAWLREHQRWIEDGEARAPCEARVRQSFRTRTGNAPPRNSSRRFARRLVTAFGEARPIGRLDGCRAWRA